MAITKILDEVTGNVTSAEIALDGGLNHIMAAFDGSDGTVNVEICPNPAGVSPWIAVATLTAAAPYFPTSSSFVKRFGGSFLRVSTTGVTGTYSVWVGVD